jgi:hypothetical protein
MCWYIRAAEICAALLRGGKMHLTAHAEKCVTHNTVYTHHAEGLVNPKVG